MISDDRNKIFEMKRLPSRPEELPTFVTATIDSLTGGKRPPVILACSGGRDSVVLADAVVRGGYPSVILGHINHGLRPDDETRADRRVVTALARRLGIECVLREVTIGLLDATGDGEGVEARARFHRYRLLHAIAEEAGDGAVIVTAHHRGDQAETILMRILSGRSPFSAVSIPVWRAGVSGSTAILRPLLNIHPELIAAYAAKHNLIWHDDSTNEDNRYLRNYVRNALIPQVGHRFPGIADSLVNLGTDIEALRNALTALIPAAAWGSYEGEDRWSVPVSEVSELPFAAMELIFRSAVHRVSADNRLSFAAVRDFLHRSFAEDGAGPGGSTAVSDIVVSIQDGSIVVQRAVVPIIESGYLFVVPKDEPVVFAGMTVELGDSRSGTVKDIHWGPVTPPVVVRSSRAGDRLYRKAKETGGKGSSVVEDIAGTVGEFSNDGKDVVGPGQERNTDDTPRGPYIRVQFNS